MGDQDPFDLDEGEEEFALCGQECYQFNDALDVEMDDDCCEHCRFYLTTQCPHIDMFIQEMDG